MFAYQTPISSFQRLLYNDTSSDFQIIITINQKITQNEIIIEKQKQIIINTTINKARIISKIINDEYTVNQNIDQYTFNLGNLKYHTSEIIDIFQVLINNHNGNHISIAGNKRNIFTQILNILDNGTNAININDNVIECKYLNNNDMFNGIIAYIKRSTNDRVDGTNNHLILSGSGVSPFFPLSNILLYDDNDILKVYLNYNTAGTFTEKDAYIDFDFVNNRINMTSYTIRTIYNPVNSYHPRSWKFVGSNDQTNWEMIDMKIDNKELNGPSYCSHFQCSETGKYYRYIRYIQFDNWYAHYHHGSIYCIGLSAIEFFGFIKTS